MGTVTLAGGILFEQRRLLAFGAVFLLEEPGAVILVLSVDRAAAARS